MSEDNGHSVSHNRDSDGFKVTTYNSKDNTRESVDYKPSGGGWNRDDDSRHSTNQNYPKGHPKRH